MRRRECEMVRGNKEVWRDIYSGIGSIGYNYHKCSQKNV